MLRKYFKRLVSKQYDEIGLNGYVYEFSVDYEALNPPLNVTKTVPILHDYFMIKYKIKGYYGNEGLGLAWDQMGVC